MSCYTFCVKKNIFSVYKQYYIINLHIYTIPIIYFIEGRKMVTKKWRHLPTGLARACANLAFVPRHRSAREEDIEKLTQFLANKQKLVVLTGAGTN